MRTTLFGKGSDYCGEENAAVAVDAALNEVRCCSETSLPGWIKRENCKVWAQSNLIESATRTILTVRL